MRLILRPNIGDLMSIRFSMGYYDTNGWNKQRITQIILQMPMQ